MDDRDGDNIDRGEGPSRIGVEEREASRRRQERSSDAEFGKKIDESEGGMRGIEEDH